MGGMRFNTAYNHKQRVLGMLAEVYQSAQIFGMPSHKINERTIAAKKTLPKNTPQWVHSYLSGWEHAVNGMIQRQVIFCYTVQIGPNTTALLSTHRDRDDYYEKHGLGPKEVYDKATHSGHYWDIKGELRPYFVQPIERKEGSGGPE